MLVYAKRKEKIMPIIKWVVFRYKWTLFNVIRNFAVMKRLKDYWKKYNSFFVDIWQYLIIIVLFALAAIFFL